MKLYRVSALVERDMRKFFRSPALMLSSLLFPLVQLVVLGYAFGGKIKNADIAFVDEDHSVQSRRIEEMFDGIKAGPQTFRVVPVSYTHLDVYKRQVPAKSGPQAVHGHDGDGAAAAA